MIKSEAEALVRREKEKTYVLSISRDLKPPYAGEVTAKPYQMGYITPQFQKFDEKRRNTTEHVVRCLDSIEANARDIDLFVRKSLST